MRTRPGLRFWKTRQNNKDVPCYFGQKSSHIPFALVLLMWLTHDSSLTIEKLHSKSPILGYAFKILYLIGTDGLVNRGFVKDLGHLWLGYIRKKPKRGTLSLISHALDVLFLWALLYRKCPRSLLESFQVKRPNGRAGTVSNLHFYWNI